MTQLSNAPGAWLACASSCVFQCSTMRPSARNIARVQRAGTVSTTCVEITIACRPVAASSRIISLTSKAAKGSRPLRDSSKIRSFGDPSSAAAIEIFAACQANIRRSGGRATQTDRACLRHLRRASRLRRRTEWTQPARDIAVPTAPTAVLNRRSLDRVQPSRVPERAQGRRRLSQLFPSSSESDP